MDTSIRVNGNAIKILSRNTNTKVSQWGASENQHHTIMVSTVKGAISFDFWASQAQPYVRSANDLIGAFSCLLSDAMCVKDIDYEDFCGDMGYEMYDEDTFEFNEKSQRIYRACETALEQVESLGLDIYDTYNEISEKYDI